MDIEQLYQHFAVCTSVTTDSRNCPEGSLFVALKGESFDGNKFALSSLEKGCRYAVVDDPQYAIDGRFLLVDDCLEALQQLAKEHRLRLGTPIVGITGTNGKTTTKELIAAVLSKKYNTLFTQGNLNNHIGVPLTLLGLKPEHEMAVVEMGANHPGEIKTLANIACPDFGIITNVGKAHLEGFGSFEGVKKTKAELYAYISKNGKNIFLNKGNAFLCQMAANSGFDNPQKDFCYCVSDKNEDCKVTGQIAACSPFLSVLCKVDDSKHFQINTQLIGSYNTENVLAAVTIGNFFGVSESQIIAGLEKYTPKNNRSQLTVTENNRLVVDAYNANPTSMKAAIENFAIMEIPDKLLILGDMLELGNQSAEEHQSIINLL